MVLPIIRKWLFRHKAFQLLLSRKGSGVKATARKEEIYKCILGKDSRRVAPRGDKAFSYTLSLLFAIIGGFTIGGKQSE